MLIPQPVSTEIQGIRRALGDPSLERYQPHITVVPPLNINDDHLEDILDLLRRTGARFKRMHLSVGSARSFAPDNDVVYLAVDDPVEQLDELKATLSVDPLRPDTGRAFVPHITVGRGDIAAAEHLSKFKTQVDVDRVHLVQQGDGGAWSAIADFAFEPPMIVGRGGLEIEMAVTELVDPVASLLVPDVRDTSIVVTARVAGEVAGVVAGKRDGGLLFLEALTVRPEMRGLGVGAHLLSQFVNACRKAGVAEIVIDCHGEPSFFQRHGFSDRVTEDRLQLVVKAREN